MILWQLSLWRTYIITCIIVVHNTPLASTTKHIAWSNANKTHLVGHTNMTNMYVRFATQTLNNGRILKISKPIYEEWKNHIILSKDRLHVDGGGARLMMDRCASTSIHLPSIEQMMCLGYQFPKKPLNMMKLPFSSAVIPEHLYLDHRRPHWHRHTHRLNLKLS